MRKEYVAKYDEMVQRTNVHRRQFWVAFTALTFIVSTGFAVFLLNGTFNFPIFSFLTLLAGYCAVTSRMSLNNAVTEAAGVKILVDTENEIDEQLRFLDVVGIRFD
jgi:hypothetical protein